MGDHLSFSTVQRLMLALSQSSLREILRTLRCGTSIVLWTFINKLDHILTLHRRQEERERERERERDSYPNGFTLYMIVSFMDILMKIMLQIVFAFLYRCHRDSIRLL